MQDTKQKTVLVVEVVEDEPSYQHILSEKLEQKGFGVVRARDGISGFDNAIEKHPDLILLDIIMPAMDGAEMLRKLRTSGAWGKNVPVFILTNVATPDDTLMKKIAEFAPTYYFEKTAISIDALIEKIHEQLSSTAGQ